jgi:hypothetical protein
LHGVCLLQTFCAVGHEQIGIPSRSTASFIDPGFSGHITLELSNVANLPLTLYPGVKIGRLRLSSCRALRSTRMAQSRRAARANAEGADITARVVDVQVDLEGAVRRDSCPRTPAAAWRGATVAAFHLARKAC